MICFICFPFTLLVLIFCILFVSSKLIKENQEKERKEHEEYIMAETLYSNINISPFINNIKYLKDVYKESLKFAKSIWNEEQINNSSCINGSLLLLVSLINEHIKELIIDINKYIESNNIIYKDIVVNRYLNHVKRLLLIEPDLKSMKNLQEKTQLIKYLEKRKYAIKNYQTINNYETLNDILNVIYNYDNYIDILFSTVYLDMFKNYDILIHNLNSMLNYDKYIMKIIIKEFLEQ